MAAEKCKSPLTDRPLNVPGQSGDSALREFVDDHIIFPLFLVMTLFFITLWEWFASVRHLERHPGLFALIGISALAFVLAYAKWRWSEIKARILGRNGERAVGQFLDTHVENDAVVFHDVVGPNGNIDHVIICSRGIYAIETKTRTKPASGPAIVAVQNDRLTVGGWVPDRDPIIQAKACANELMQILKASTGKPFEVRPVVAFPGWFIEDKRASQNSAWVLEPKSLPGWIKREPVSITPENVSLASYHLSRHIRTQP